MMHALPSSAEPTDLQRQPATRCVLQHLYRLRSPTAPAVLLRLICSREILRALLRQQILLLNQQQQHRLLRRRVLGVSRGLHTRGLYPKLDSEAP